ncbi:hypothetical protein [Conexibacter sp. SYSU D00693]|uniref:hypothetical protein n=1 Tax=Conexibacter sp. SYSU D00693 TaxID=2812560 RepID=UPI00196A82D8|nr:hypothetical protein [Conexibacter sp. SYSU D00693]
MSKAKKPRKGGRPAPPKAEPTTHQLRQEYYKRRSEQQALVELGLVDTEREPPKGDASWWADTRDALDRLEIVHAVWRWAGLTGGVPEPEDWDPQQGWPSEKEVEQVFKGWDDLLEQSGIGEAIFAEVTERVLEAHGRLREGEAALEAATKRLEREQRKLPELRRLAETARAKRDEADARAREAEAVRDALERERDALARRVEQLAGEAAAARASAAESGPADEDLVAEVERLAGAHDTALAERDAAHVEVERLREAAEQDRRTIAELTRALALVDQEDEAAAAEVVHAEDEPPESVLEAVERAASEARHLRFSPRAFETAAESPFRRPGLVLKTLRALDEMAERFAGGDMGRSLVQAAAEHGITQYRQDVAETTRKRYEDEYTFTWEGHKLWVGPHVGLGSGSGAGFVARIYLHVADGSEDGVPRGIYVGPVGRHLPDTTT